jgi:hypothetical protein
MRKDLEKKELTKTRWEVEAARKGVRGAKVAFERY